VDYLSPPSQLVASPLSHLRYQDLYEPNRLIGGCVTAPESSPGSHPSCTSRAMEAKATLPIITSPIVPAAFNHLYGPMLTQYRKRVRPPQLSGCNVHWSFPPLRSGSRTHLVYVPPRGSHIAKTHVIGPQTRHLTRCAKAIMRGIWLMIVL